MGNQFEVVVEQQSANQDDVPTPRIVREHGHETHRVSNLLTLQRLVPMSNTLFGEGQM
ncbi:MAG: hypothetical protein Q6364_02120 [Candidatus Hermodarchaeota archaeon]|nr:hypothetical protein [Candidatus Hermodarchaeota archaeon]